MLLKNIYFSGARTQRGTRSSVFMKHSWLSSRPAIALVSLKFFSPSQGLHSEAQCCLILLCSVQQEGMSASRGSGSQLKIDLNGKDPNNLLNGEFEMGLAKSSLQNPSHTARSDANKASLFLPSLLHVCSPRSPVHLPSPRGVF